MLTDSTAVGLHEAFGRILDRANSIATSSTSRIITLEHLEAIARALRCEWAVSWEADSAGKFLNAASIWKLSEVKAQEVEQDTYARQLRMSEATAGHVWRSRKPIWMTDVFRVMCSPRCLLAKQAGLEGGVWIPLKTLSAVYGVLEIVATRADAVIAVERLAVSFGYLIEAALLDGRAPSIGGLPAHVGTARFEP